jgi:hypothetical protein
MSNNEDGFDSTSFADRCMERVDRISLRCLCTDKSVRDIRMTEKLLYFSNRVKSNLLRGVVCGNEAVALCLKQIAALEKIANEMVSERLDGSANRDCFYC